MGMPTSRFNLPISWAACARWLSSSTNLRSRSSIFLRQSEMSIEAISPVVGPWSSVVDRLQDDKAYDQRLSANDQLPYEFCHRRGFFAGIALDRLDNRAADHCGVG